MTTPYIDEDLNIDTPDKLGLLLARMADQFDIAADEYEQSAGELQGAWGDPNAGLVWGELAKRARGTAGLLRKQAAACERTCGRFGM